MNSFAKPIFVTILGLTLVPVAAGAEKIEELALGEAVERHLPDDKPFMIWVQDPDRIDSEEGDTLETRETIEDALETIKLSNLVPPIRFESGIADIPGTTVESLAEILDRMRDRINVRLHLIGHADNQPLSRRLVEIYGDNVGLSRERAGQVAEHFQTQLSLPPEAISFEWAGDQQPVASNKTDAGRAQNRRVEVEVWYDEVVDRVALEEFLVPHQIDRIKVCRMETVCKLRYVDGHARRARVKNLIAPLRYNEESIDVSADFVARIDQGLANLADKQNVVVRFVGYSDDTPLTGRTERIYGTPLGLSKARARRVALAVQEALNLSTATIASDGLGPVKPVAANETSRGRALNRRVEVEFWYDDPLQELPDEPQICPGSTGAEMVSKIYDPPWGQIANIEIVDGQPDVPAGYTDTLARALGDVADKAEPRLRFVGYTGNRRLARRTAAVYGDDIGLSASRARRAMEQIAADMSLDETQREFEGRGYVHSHDVVNSGFIQEEAAYVAIEVVYDELAVLDDYDGVDITRVTRELNPQHPLSLNLMRITVDGVPIDDPNRSSSDIQRCTDVALQAADIQFGFDNLRSAPRLSVAAAPSQIAITSLPDNDATVTPVTFQMYANYSSFIDHAEVRVFNNGQSLESKPLDVVEIDTNGIGTWLPPNTRFTAPVSELAYVLRAYGKDGNFDETHPQPLWVVYDAVDPTGMDAPEDVGDDVSPLVSAYGKNSLSRHNIGLGSGTVDVRGSGVPPDHKVWVAGRAVPTDANGNFVTEEILPTGTHTVEVAVLDENGGGELYLRDLEFKSSDWFWVGMADLTISASNVSGPADLLTGEGSDFDIESGADARLAFFVNGKFGEHWQLTASADTQEGAIGDLFSNFMDKSPDALLRRIDTDYYYPTFGDDSTVVEMAPTMGKFFVRLSDGDNHGQWGSFKIGYMNNELAQVDRGLYGANLHYQSDSTTGFGEQRYAVDAFAAEPGTVAGRDEFRGTGGSLYFLRRQDILQGSERVRIELRDKTSGIVTGVVNLMPAMDYDVDYLQGRVVLAEPLSSTVDDGLLVRSNAISGNEAFLVVRYEYTPGFDDLDAMAFGGQAHYWFGERVKLGVTSSASEEGGNDSSLTGADLTLRLTAETWLKLQQADSAGLVSSPLLSNDGGFGFSGYDPYAFTNASATANRADLSLASNDLLNFGNVQLTFYKQDVDAGYSAPGLTALTDARNYGGTFNLPLGESFNLAAKVDKRIQEQGLETKTQEVNIGYRVADRWQLSAGYRKDSRIDRSPIAALTQEQGERADAVLQLRYDSMTDWQAYAFTQDTVSVTGDRQENARTGFGGSYRVSERFNIDAEISDGDLGSGASLGSNYLHSERTSLYLNYALQNDANNDRLRAPPGAGGNLVAGIKSRIADSTSVYLEERYQHSETMNGLTHGTGITFAPSQKWNLGFNTDIGTLVDLQSGADTRRLAGGVQLAFGTDALQVSSGIEYRNDDAEQLDLGTTERTTWLFRNNIKYHVNPDARLLGKLNYSQSDSSLGTFYDGGFTEASLGYAYRPTQDDRLNALVKYTYFHNIPTTGQVSLQNTSAEFVQKSHIAAVDVTYDVTPRFTVGGKYAYRLGQVSLDRDNPEFFDNNASLYVVRGDYRVGERWEVLVEGRMLDMPDLNESRSGALATVSRYLGDHLKIGIGYNFTDFSDDLTDLSFDHHGVFLNLVGTM